MLTHGAGALSGWSLTARLDGGGGSRALLADVSFEADFLPARGSLGGANVTGSAGNATVLRTPRAGSAIEGDPSTARARASCGGAGAGACGDNFGLGPLLTGDERGEARPAGPHRVTWGVSDHRVVFGPSGGFVGEDSFRYRAWVMGAVSDARPFRLSVRRCRGLEGAKSSAGACGADTAPDLF